jgi:hypothetical protein
VTPQLLIRNSACPVNNSRFAAGHRRALLRARTVDGRRVFVTQVRAWMWSCPRARRSVRDLVGQSVPGPRGGHAATETDRRQPCQPTSEVPETNGSNVSGTNQLVLESIDTVGVRSSILRSPTPNPPDSGGFSHFQTTVGPRWGRASVGWRWIGPVRVWPRVGRQNFSGSLSGWLRCTDALGAGE